MALADDIDSSGYPALGRWRRATAVAVLLLAGAAQVGESDLAKAEQLLKEGQAA